MNIPPEIAKELGWEPGDVLKIEIMKEGGISISKVKNE
jgi:AbrB family looped-hinge helix DNA binding protein